MLHEADMRKTQSVQEMWQEAPPNERILDVRFLPPSLWKIPSYLAPLCKTVFKINELLAVYNKIPAKRSSLEFAQNALDIMDITLQVDAELENNIPKEGPLIIVCNHPLGGVDGLALLAALLPHRPDVKILVNSVLGVFPEIRAASFPLDILSSSSASLTCNASSLRAAGQHVQDGGAILFFPSGIVSHWQYGQGIVDPPWQMSPARFAKRYNAPVLPLYLKAKTSKLFNLVGCFSSIGRTCLLPRELAVSRGKTFDLRCGRLVDPLTIKLLHSPESITAYLRMRSYGLANNSQENVETEISDSVKKMEEIAPSSDANLIEAAFASLGEEEFLFREGAYAAYILRGGQSEILLKELGVLREYAFRLVGEGSGKARDLDMYDTKYYHLLLWHEEDKRIVGAYRLGKVQELLAEEGKDGLYTTTLFSIDDEFFRRYGHSLELGRAVIHPEYQREYLPLMLLWKGIGAFLQRNEDIQCLFGPVSLSLAYSPFSLGTVIEYLLSQFGSPELARLVKGKTMPRTFLRFAKEFPLPESLSYNGLVSLIKDVEGGKGIPILFKHYLKLGGKIVTFHVDTSFNSLDAFLFIDLAKSPKAMLERYMGAEGAERFLARWG